MVNPTPSAPSAPLGPPLGPPPPYTEVIQFKPVMKHAQVFMILGKKTLEIVGKGEKASNQHFLLFPQCFPLYQRAIGQL